MWGVYHYLNWVMVMEIPSRYLGCFWKKSPKTIQGVSSVFSDQAIVPSYEYPKKWCAASFYFNKRSIETGSGKVGSSNDAMHSTHHPSDHAHPPWKRHGDQTWKYSSNPNDKQKNKSPCRVVFKKERGDACMQ
jgi:hypothetical protein